MTNPTCHNCDEPIQFIPNKNGKMEPFDFVFRSHYASCQKRKKVEKVEEPPAVLALVAWEIKVTEARKLVKGLKGTDQEIVKQALRRRDEERRM